MASSARRFDDGTFVGYARQHVFVTVFGVAVPLLVFACFIGYPILYTIYLSFFEWNGMAPQKKFVGFANYAYLFHDSSSAILLNRVGRGTSSSVGYQSVAETGSSQWLCGFTRPGHATIAGTRTPPS